MAAPPVPDIAAGNQAFSTAMRAFHAWEAGELSDALDAYESTRLLSTTATSTSSVAIGIGDRTFTVPAGLGFVAGQSVNSVSTANPANSVSGFVKSYVGTSLVVTVISISGSGTFASWAIALGLSAGGASLGINNFNNAQNFAQGSDIASAATINLTTATGNLVTVTGVVATSAVTLGVGMTRLVRASAAWPLTYNATTNNISGGVSTVLAAGDHVFYHNISGVVYGLIIKANGQSVAPPNLANESSPGIVEKATTAEAQAFTADKYIDAARLGDVVLGGNQTWQNLTGSRANGTTYTNSTGKPIVVSIRGTIPANGGPTLTVAGIVINSGVNGSGDRTVGHTLFGIVPNGGTYVSAGLTISVWAELR